MLPRLRHWSSCCVVSRYGGSCVQQHEKLRSVRPLHAVGWIELQGLQVLSLTVKQQLATIRHLFDWLITRQVVPGNSTVSRFAGRVT